MHTSINLIVTPKDAVMDVPVTITVDGLPANHPVTVRARWVDGIGTEWSSYALYQTDASGYLDLSKQPPVQADYIDTDPMGLIWSMRPTDTTRRYMPVHATTTEPSRVLFAVEVDGQIVASAEVLRHVIAPGVRREEVRVNGLAGTLFLPSSGGKYPAVTVVSGSGGGVNEHRAALYAAHGYAAFALAYFNYESLPASLVRIPLEYFETSIAYLRSRPEIDGERLAIAGGSRGGELALLLGATFSAYRAVIAEVPSGVIWGGFGHDPAEGAQPSWTYHGEGLPYMSDPDPEIYAYYAEYAARGEAIPGTPGFQAIVDRNPNQVAQALIPVEKTQGAILMISGDDDQMWPSTPLAEIAMRRLQEKGFSYPYEHISYAGAGHFIAPPYAPTTTIAINHPVDGGYYTFGGKPEANYRASVDSWHKRLQFLHQYL
jgi:dienelactone hydrolase